MFSLLVQVQVRPGHREEFVTAIADNAAASVRDEPGCLRFDVCSIEAGDDRFLFYELYTDAAAFAAHKATPHYAQWQVAAARTLVPGSQVKTPGTLLVTQTAEESA